MKPTWNRLLLLVALLTFAIWSAQAASENPLKGCRGTYDNAPRLASGRVDIPRLIGELVELHVNTYNWLVWHQPTDWDDLQAFLPLAREKKIQVWVTLVPPSEAPPRTRNFSEPYKLDYLRWAEEIGKLSVREKNLVAWSIDDFAHNLKVFTPEQIAAMQTKARQQNPQLLFVPCVYYRQVTPAFAKRYGKLLDGILFPYRAESAPKPNLTDATRVAAEVKKVRDLMGRKKLPVIIDVYATRHSQLGDSSPAYVRDVMQGGKASADGVLIYCHQDKQRAAEKYNVIKTLFTQWAEK